MKAMGDYHNLYMETDIVLSSHISERFFGMC